LHVTVKMILSLANKMEGFVQQVVSLFT